MYSSPCLCEVSVGCLLLLGTCVQFLDVIAVYTPSVCWLELMLLYPCASFVV